MGIKLSPRLMDRRRALIAKLTSLFKKVTTSQTGLASFNTNVTKPMKVTCEFSPKQDLHGQSSPWPAGGGNNLLLPIETVTKNGVTLTNDNGKYTLSGTATANTFFTVNLPSTLSAGSYYYQLWNETTQSGITCYLLLETGNIQLSTNVVRNGMNINPSYGITAFRIRVDAETVLSNYKLSPTLVLGDTPFESFEPYSNICPISGWTEANVEHTGKNLFDVSSYPITEGKYVNYSKGTLTANVSYACTEGFISCKHLQGKTITLNKNGGGYTPGIAFYSEANATSYISGISDDGATAGTPKTFAVPINANYMRMTVALGEANLQLELSSTASAYELYQGDTISISWATEAGTIYGGTLDVVTGVLTVPVNDADMGDLEYTRIENGGIYAFRSAVGAILVTDKTQHGLTSIYPFAGTRFIAAMPDKSWMIDANGRFIVRDDLYSDVATFKAAMSGQTLIYELATPQTYQLSNIGQFQSFLGINNVWSDLNGPITVEYYKKQQ